MIQYRSGGSVFGRRRRPRLLAALVAAGVASVVLGGSSSSHAQGVPAGFAVTTYAHAGGTATSLAFGPDTRNLLKTRLYVAVNSSGQIVAIDDVAGVGSSPQVFGSGFGGPLGVLVAGDGTVFVADAEGPRGGPFGERTYGRVTRLRDTNGDGAADVREVVLKDLPNGRHNTNNMAFGPDGMLYVTNGNSTDDGVEGGDPEVPPWSGSIVRVDPAATDLSLASLPRATTLVATGMRNIFDLAFSPFDPTHLFIPMNGTDDARKNDAPPPDHLEDSDDLLYRTDVDDVRGKKKKKAHPVIDNFGFPSCLYNQQRRGNLEPYDNPNPDTIALFGRCPVASVPRPAWSFGLHVSADGLAFQRTNAWGADFRNDLFVAEFGNFFGDEVVGHKVVRIQLGHGGTTVVSEEDFLTGGLPLDVTFDAAGNMFVADFSGAILKVTKVA